MSERTPPPWHVSEYGAAACAESDEPQRPDARIIANIMDPDDHQHQTPTSLANAAYIVKAVNNHEPLIEALNGLLGSEVYADGEGMLSVEHGGCDDREHREIVAKAQAAIEAAS